MYIRSLVLYIFVGKHWRGFAGIDNDELASHFEQACKKHSLTYTHSEISPSFSDKIGYGAYKDKHMFEIQLGGEDGGVVIEIIPAYADPVTRGVLMLFTSQKRIESMKNISILDIQPITDTTELPLQNVMSSVIRESDKELWDCSHHPRFVTGILLQYKTKFLWSYWSNPM